jgi:hypothetical protein
MIPGYHARQLARYLLGAIGDLEKRGGVVPRWVRSVANASATAGLAWERASSNIGTDVRNDHEEPSSCVAVNIMTTSEVAASLGVTSRWVSELARENGGELRPLRRAPLLFARAEVVAYQERNRRR